MSERRFTLAAIGVLVLVEAALWLPALTGQPAFLREEWQFLYRAENFGAWFAADEATAAMRPLVRVLYAGIYGVAATHPAIIVLSPILVLAVGVAWFLFLKSFVGLRWAFATALIWLILPTHLTLEHWLATANINLALLLSLLGLILWSQQHLSRTRTAISGLLFGFAVLAYEAVFPGLFAALIVIAFIKQWHDVKRRMLIVGSVMAPFVMGVIALSVGPREKVFASPLSSAYQNFGIVRESFNVAIVLLAGCVLCFALFSIVAIRRRRVTPAFAMLLAGAVLWFLGYLPFSMSGYDAVFAGIGDRANCVSSFGVALFYGGLLKALASRSVIKAAMVGAAAGIALTGLHISRGVEWAQSTDSVQTVGDCLLSREAVGTAIALEDTAGWLSDGAMAIDAASELQLYLRFGGERPSSTLRLVPPGVDPNALNSSVMLANSSTAVRNLGCA